MTDREGLSGLTEAERRVRIDRRIEEVEWASQSDPEWALVRRLRDKAVRTRNSATILLLAVIAVGALGAVFVFSETFELIETPAQAEQRANEKAARAKLNAATEQKRVITKSFEDLRTEIGSFVQRDFGRVYWPGRTGNEALQGVHIAEDGSAVVHGDQGTLLTRAADSGDWVAATWEGRTGTETLRGVHLAEDGSAVVPGNQGTLLTRAADSGDWVAATWEGRNGNERLRGVHVAEDGSAVVHGDPGTLLTRAADSGDWVAATWDGRTGNETLWDVHVAEDGSAVVHGDQGTLLMRAADSGDWVAATWEGRSGNERLWGVHVAEDGSAIVRGDQGTLLTRAADSGDWVAATWDGRTGNEELWGVHVAEDGSAVVHGDRGTLLTVQPLLGERLDAEESPQSLIDLLTTSAQFPQTEQWITTLQEGRVSAAQADADINVAEAEIRAAQAGRVTRAAQLGDMGDFLDQCMPRTEDVSASNVAMLDACTNAFVAAVDPRDENEMFRFLANRLTPALLVIFLLATMGSGYRYNLRLAAFYESRANAIVLWAHKRRLGGGEEKDVDINPLIEAMAGEVLGFREVRTPVDQVVELAKSAAGKISPKGGSS